MSTTPAKDRRESVTACEWFVYAGLLLIVARLGWVYGGGS